MYISENNRIGISVDCSIFSLQEKKLHVLLSKRKVLKDQFEWSLPGDFLKREENLRVAAKRILEEMGGIKDVYTEQVKTFGDIDRYPIERVVTVSYYALINPEEYQQLSYHSSVEETKWFPVRELPVLTLDHQKILETSVNTLKKRIRVEPIGIKLLPKKFTLTQLQHLYEGILELPLDVRNFRKKILKLDFLEKLDEKEENVAHRRANYYSFDENKYNDLLKKGFYFDI